MAWTDVVARKTGAREYALVIEGSPILPTSGSRSFSTLNSDAGSNYPVQLSGALQLGFKIRYETDFLGGSPSMGAIAFSILDKPLNATTKWAISSIMSASVRANRANLRATANAAAASIQVDSVAAFASAGVGWINQEAFRYSSLGAAPTRFVVSDRGIYHSEAQVHTYDAFDPAASWADLGIEPIVFDLFPSWVGRRVHLYVAEVLTDGTLSTPVARWHGKVKSAPVLGSDNLEWIVTCEHLWDAQDVNFLSATARTQAFSGVVVDRPVDGGPDLSWIWDDWGGFTTRFGEVTLAETQYDSVADLCTALSAGLDASVVADGIVPERYVIQVGEDGRVEMFQSSPDAFASGMMRIMTQSRAITSALGHDGDVEFPMDPDLRSYGGVATSYLTFPRDQNSWLPVESVAGFSAFDAWGEGYHLQSLVIIRGEPYILHDVDAGPPARLGIRPLYPSTPTEIEVVAGERVEVTMGLLAEGDMVSLWQELLENASIPEPWRFGLRSSDYDWAELYLYDFGGAGFRRHRVFTEPEPFRSMVLADMRAAGMVPAIGATTQLLSTRPLAPPSFETSLGTLGLAQQDAETLPTLTPSTEKVVTRVTFVAEKPWNLETDTPAENVWTLPQIFGTLEHVYGAHEVTIKCAGLWQTSLADFASHAVAVASSYVALFGTEALVGELPCVISAAELLPGDAIQVTHPTVPNPATGGRGITNALAMVMAVQEETAQPRVVLLVHIALGNERRGGWGPCALVDSIIDNGLGAGDARYELTLDAAELLRYALDHNEGLDFTAGMRIYLEQCDNDAPARENLIVSPAAHNAAGTSVYVTTLPVNDPAVGGPWKIRLRPYDVAGQTADAQAYVAICDETDGLIGTTADRGFQPS